MTFAHLLCSMKLIKVPALLISGATVLEKRPNLALSDNDGDVHLMVVGPYWCIGPRAKPAASHILGTHDQRTDQAYRGLIDLIRLIGPDQDPA